MNNIIRIDIPKQALMSLLAYEFSKQSKDLTPNEVGVVYGDLINLTPYIACDVTKEVELIKHYNNPKATSLIKKLIDLKYKGV